MKTHHCKDFETGIMFTLPLVLVLLQNFVLIAADSLYTDQIRDSTAVKPASNINVH